MEKELHHPEAHQSWTVLKTSISPFGTPWREFHREAFRVCFSLLRFLVFSTEDVRKEAQVEPRITWSQEETDFWENVIFISVCTEETPYILLLL